MVFQINKTSVYDLLFEYITDFLIKQIRKMSKNYQSCRIDMLRIRIFEPIRQLLIVLISTY